MQDSLVAVGFQISGMLSRNTEHGRMETHAQVRDRGGDVDGVADRVGPASSRLHSRPDRHLKLPTVLVLPSATYIHEPFRFTLQYSAIAGNYTNFGLFRDRDQISFVLSYLL